MKLTEAFQLNSMQRLDENYGMAFDLIPQVYQLASLAGIPPSQLQTLSEVDIKRFRQEAQAGRIQNKDISPWIGEANRILQIENRAKQVELATQLVRRFRETISEAEDKIPEFEVVAQNGEIRVTHLMNVAAVKKLCSRMSICIRSNERDFDTYSKHGGLFLFEIRGRKFVFEYDSRTEEGTFWNERNEELTPEEFFMMFGVRSLPVFRGMEDVVDDAFYYLYDELDSI